jgi:predicted TIM-barrel fold metal-dependent hydrolase
LGYYPFDPRLEPLFDWAADNQLPIMTHSTRSGNFFVGKLNASEHFYPQTMDAVEKAQLDELLAKRGLGLPLPEQKQNSVFCDYFGEPDFYRLVLERLKAKGKKLKICFAHFGGSDEILIAHNQLAEKDKPTVPPGYKNWHEQIKQLLSDYPSVYTDISYTLTEKKVWPHLNAEMAMRHGDQILFGTDYFMVEREGPESLFSHEYLDALRKEANGAAFIQKLTEDAPKAYLDSKFLKLIPEPEDNTQPQPQTPPAPQPPLA